ncbi:MAG: AAA family ATPase [Pseudomonadota bacterium]
MRRKVWELLRKKEVSDKLDNAVKSAWYKFTPTDGIFKFSSAFVNPDSRVSDTIKIGGSYTDADEYFELVDKQEIDRSHLETHPTKVRWLDSNKGTAHTKFPLNVQVRNYHTSSINFQKWEEDVENGLDVSEEVGKPDAFKFTIGSSNFSKLRFGDDYVDKSEFVVAFNNSGHEVCVNAFPRRFQKSTNLSTIEHFYGIEVDEAGEPLPFEERKNPVLFTGGKAVGIDGTSRFLKPLKVAAYPDIMRLQRTMPVISTDFQKVSGESYSSALSGIKSVLHDAWNQHGYLLKSTKLRTDELALVERYVDSIGYEDLTERQVKSGLQFLSRLLHTHFGVPAIILVDEYDTAINSAYRNLNIDPIEADKIIGLHRDIFGAALKGNSNLYKGLVTGILRIAKANIFSGLNNPGEFSISDKKFVGHYGFTQEDVDELMVRFDVPVELADGLKDWYNGYDVLGQLIYNPWSVIKALETFDTYRQVGDISQIRALVLQNYWQESGNFGFVSPLFKHKNVEGAFRKLSEGGKIEFDLNKQISVSDFMTLREMLGHSSSYEITPYGQDILLSYLFASGYLTPTGKKGYYRAPNKEARDEFTKRLLTHYKATYKIDTAFFRKLTDQIQLVFDAEEDGEYVQAVGGIRKTLSTLLEKLPGFVKLDRDKIDPVGSENVLHANESLIQGIVSHAAMQVLSATQFGAEVYVGDGRTDCLIIDDKSKKAIIIELKYEGDSTAAVAQIDKRGYAKPIPESYDIINIGLNVDYDKTVSVNHKLYSGGASEIMDLMAGAIDTGKVEEIVLSGEFDSSGDSTQ